MPTIGKISIGLEAEYAKFSEGTQKAAKDIHQLGEAAGHAGGGVRSFLGRDRGAA